MPSAPRRDVGRPCWTELPCTDLAVTMPFYAELLGWDYTEPDDALGGYVDATCGGAPLCGLYSLGDEERPSQWLTYLAVDSVENRFCSALEAGARPVLPVTSHQDRARIAVVSAPGHVFVGLWEDRSGHHTPAEEALGGPCWFETTSTSMRGGSTFLAAAFGVRVEESREGDWLYGTAHVEGTPAFGIVETPEDHGTPASLMPYFLVPDLQQCLDRLPEAGMVVGEGPVESPFGLYAHLTGPDLEPFGLFEADSAPA